MFKIIFSENKNNDFSENISKLTPENISHCAITNSEYVIESNRIQGVCLVKYSEFIKNNFIVDSLVTTEEIYDAAKSYIGREYNYLFLDCDKSIYCSQLVELAVNKVNPGSIIKHKLIFSNNEYWIDYYRKFGKELPSETMGTHPATIYRQLKKIQ